MVVVEAVEQPNVESGNSNLLLFQPWQSHWNVRGMESDVVPSVVPAERKRRVFLVHGRNDSAKRTLMKCLEHWGLTVVDFANISAEVGGTPFVGEVLRGALSSVQAVIVLLTPDEYSVLDLGFFLRSDKPHERSRWQPRPNVIFEAGMAIGIDERRTVMVAIGSNQGLFSDLSGRHVLELNRSSACFATLVGKLEAAGCALSRTDPPHVDFEHQVRKRRRSLWAHGIRRAGIVLLGLAMLLFLTLIVGGFANRTGISLRRNIEVVGLTDVNSRANKETDLPPEEIFTHADREILVFGISAYRTFDQHMELIKAALKAEQSVLVLLLDPNAAAVDELSRRDGKRVGEDIRSTIYRIKREGLITRPNFHVKFYDFVPHYTCIATDASVDGVKPMRAGAARVRVQPMSFYKNANHDGIIFQLDDTQAESDGFHFFAHDLRRVWQKALVHPEYFVDLPVPH